MADSTFYAKYTGLVAGGGGGVTSLNGLTGAVILAAGTGISITPAGNTLTIASTSAGDVTLAAFGSTPNANAASISGSQVLTLQPASASFPGGVSTTTQSFAGNKTFTGTIAASNLSGANTGDITLGTANGLSLVGQVLSLGLSSTSTTGALSSTDWNTFNNKGSGTVTSVALSVPATSIFGVTGSPVTTTGTLGLATTGTSGGIPYFSSTSALSSSALLTANAIVLGGGAGAAPAALGSLGTTTTVLHGNAAGAPTFGAVSLTADVSGILPVANGGSGTSSAFTTGSVIYAGASGAYSQDNANFFWDATSHRLGIGTTSPSKALSVNTDAIINTVIVGLGNGGLVSNTALGQTTLASVTSGNSLVAVGTNALNANTTGTGNIAIGYQAMAQNQTANSNIAIGSQALARLVSTGGNNIAIGKSSQAFNTGGSDNMSMGSNALNALTTGGQNTAIGTNALQSITTTSTNTAIGYIALGSTTTGAKNTAIGYAAMANSTGGDQNLALGWEAGYEVTGSNNVIINAFSTTAVGITSGSSNILLGNDVRPQSQTASNQLNIGNLLYSAGVGTGATLATGNLGITVLAPAAKLHQDSGTATATYHKFTANATTGQTSTDGFDVGIDSSGNAELRQRENLALTLYTNNTSRMSFDGSGTWTVGALSGALSASAGVITAGTLSIANGGTNSTATATAGGVGYGTGTAHAYTSAGTSNYYLKSGGAGAPSFSTLVNDTNANLLVNTTTVRNSGVVSIDYNGSTAGGMGINDTVSANGSALIGFLTGGTVRGSITNNNNTGVLYNVTSDYRLKDNVAPLAGSLDKIMRLKPVSFNWKENNYPLTGFIAHELQDVFPNSVTGEKDKINNHGKSVYQQIDKSSFIEYLVGAIQELKLEIDELKAQNKG